MAINKKDKDLDLLASKIARKIFSEGTYSGPGGLNGLFDKNQSPDKHNAGMNSGAVSAIGIRKETGEIQIKTTDWSQRYTDFLDDEKEGYTTFDASAKDVIKKSEYTYEELPIKRGDKS